MFLPCRLKHITEKINRQTKIGICIKSIKVLVAKKIYFGLWLKTFYVGIRVGNHIRNLPGLGRAGLSDWRTWWPTEASSLIDRS